LSRTESDLDIAVATEQELVLNSKFSTLSILAIFEIRKITVNLCNKKNKGFAYGTF
jgi:hypothetical protein